MAIRGCAAHSWQEEQDEPLSSVSGEMVLARVPSWPGRPAEWGSSHSNRTLTAAHFMDHCFPLQLKNCRPLAVFQPLGSSTYRNNSSLEINKKLLHGHVAFMLHDKSPSCKITGQLVVDDILWVPLFCHGTLKTNHKWHWQLICSGVLCVMLAYKFLKRF